MIYLCFYKCMGTNVLIVTVTPFAPFTEFSSEGVQNLTNEGDQAGERARKGCGHGAIAPK